MIGGRRAGPRDPLIRTGDQDFGKLVFGHGAPHVGMIRLPDVPADGRIALMDDLLRHHAEDGLVDAVVTIRGSRVRVSRPAPS